MSTLAPPITYDQFIRTPETNLHVEVEDGRMIVRDMPGGSHQRAIGRLVGVLDAAAPPGFEAVPSPYDWIIRREDPLRVRQPDVLVLPSQLVEAGRLHVPPLLAVEILSDSSVRRDIVTKPREYAAAGLDHYWTVDVRSARRAWIAVHRRDGDHFVEVDRVVGAAALHVAEPFAVALRPVDLTTRR